jgi:acetylornithine deacetylase/succinyl-diaminopimelate desuccinylase-like protein
VTRNLPKSAQLELTRLPACDPGRVQIDAPPVQLEASAFERVLGRRPLMLRSGGSLPIMSVLGRRGIPAVVTGFAVPRSTVHAPNERMRESDLADAVSAARETFSSLISLE